VGQTMTLPGRWASRGRRASESVWRSVHQTWHRQWTQWMWWHYNRHTSD